MKQRLLLWVIFVLTFLSSDLQAQSWIVKDSILIFPEGFPSWFKRHNGGVDLANPGSENSIGNNGVVGTNQGVEVFDFNKDGRRDLIFQLSPSNTATREYLRGIFLQNTEGKYILDTNYIIKGKGDIWYGSFGDFNGDGLYDYHYLTSNYHGADSNRKFNKEMVGENWPERVFINNGKSFDTLSLDKELITAMSSYVADVDNDGSDEIIATTREQNDFVVVYKYDKTTKNFLKINAELSSKWASRFKMNVTRYPIFNVGNENSKNGFAVMMNDSAIGNNIGQPYNFRKFTYATYDYTSKIIKATTLSRDSVFIPIKYSKEDADDYYKFSLHDVPSIYKLDIDNNGEEELIAGGYYQNNYDIKKQRFAYGWRILGLNGKDLTSQFFEEGGFDRNVDLTAHGLDIDENTKGIEMIPGTWGADGGNTIGTVGYYYRAINGKLEKYFIRDIKHESGKRLDSTYFKTMQIAQYPNYKSNKNALLMYDFQNIRRASIIFQANCSESTKPLFDQPRYAICGSDSTIVKMSNFKKTDSTIWYVNGVIKATNLDQLVFKNTDTIFVKKIDSVGCVKNSDTIRIQKYNNPPSPIISRDSLNFLVATGGINIKWYKDGILITDSTQKLKPTSPGNYTAKTSENGCLSAASNPYYYLITDIIRLNNNEYIKIAPNPIQNKLSLEFVLMKYQRLNIEIFDMASGIRLFSRNELASGSSIFLGHLSPGNYIVKLISNDNKFSQNFKIIKL